jgi:ATP-dependent helicase/nuclease subunit A
MTVADAPAREAIRTDLDATLIVEAAAGTGKTTELIGRIVAVLASGRAAIGGIVAVTFTERAAGELKLRLRAALETARRRATDAAPRAHLERALARLEEARVNTIHGFCADLLRERPVEARVDPQFTVLPEGEAERLFATAFSRWLGSALAHPPAGIRRALRRRGRDAGGGPIERLRTAAWQLAEWRDFPAPWPREPFDRGAALAALVTQVLEFADLTDRCASPRSDLLYRDTAGARRFRDEVRRAAAIEERDDDALEAALVELLAPPYDLRRARARGAKFYYKDLPRAAVDAERTRLCAALEAFKRAADADLAAALHDELRGAIDVYDGLKRRAGALDFVDLLVRARDLIRDVDEVRAEFQRRFTHLFVDEFQDTDPLQAEILLLLSADDPAQRDWQAVTPRAGKLFIVGDPKQSIYRFRRADVGTYLAVKSQLAARGGTSVELTTSFRARPSMQRFVNAAFAPQMRADDAALQPDYVPLAPARGEDAAQPTIIALPVPAPYGARVAVTKTAIEASLPDAVGAFVAWLVRDSGWRVTERDGHEAVPLAPRHVCVLFRRLVHAWSNTDVSRAYVRALEARGIPHLLVGGKSFHDREEVEMMRAALTAIEWPDDELAVFATLRGGLFAIGDDELFVYRHTHGHLHPFSVPGDLPERLAPIGDALRLIASLHRGRNTRPVADTIASLLDRTRAHAGLALRPSGEQALANVLHLAELARCYEAAPGTLSFRGVVERLLDDADRAQTSEAPILEDGSDGVRIMTVHKAKGLEFPVVVLADITAQLTGGAKRWIDPTRRLCAQSVSGWMPAALLAHETEESARDAAEGTRIAYVAATRARDLLVVPAVGDEPFTSGWVSGLNQALYPPPAQRRSPAAPPACPPLGGDTVLNRPPELAFTVEGVAPGHHQLDGYAVTWWSPSALALGVQPMFGIHRRELLDKEGDPEVLDANVRRFTEWENARRAGLARGAAPTYRVSTATARALAPCEVDSSAIEVLAAERTGARPTGRRFGSLVHAVLATVSLDADADAIASTTAVQARLLGADAVEQQAAAEAVRAALAHPLLRRAAAARLCRRETPLTLRDADGTLIEGVVDLAFEEQGEWVVIDFKTDQDIGAALDVYRRQVALYAHAISTATGRPARGILLRI